MEALIASLLKLIDKYRAAPADYAGHWRQVVEGAIREALKFKR